MYALYVVGVVQHYDGHVAEDAKLHTPIKWDEEVDQASAACSLLT